jgi:hypothetical protein
VRRARAIIVTLLELSVDPLTLTRRLRQRLRDGARLRARKFVPTTAPIVPSRVITS